MKNIIWLTLRFPYPPHSGTDIRIFNLLKRVSHQYHIHLISFAWPDTTKTHIKHMNPYCKTINIIQHPFKFSIAMWLANFFISKPYKISQFSNHQMQKKIQMVANNYPIDLVLVDHLFLFNYTKISPLKRTPTIITAHNVESDMIKRYFDSGNFAGKIYGWSQYKKLKVYEKYVFNAVTRIVSVSEEDKERIINDFKISKAKIVVISNGVDIDYFNGSLSFVEKEKEIVFTGSMYAYPNQQGLSFFMKEVFPILLKQYKNIKFHIVGDNPSEQIKSYHDNKNVFVTGKVKDVRPYLRRSAIAIVPLFIGGGSRLKILEALSMGIPVVSTSIGCEGLHLQNNKNILIADTKEEFIESIQKLFSFGRFYEKIITNGQELAQNLYNWDSIANNLNALLIEEMRK